MKLIILMVFLLFISGCIKDGKWFGLIGDAVLISDTGNELENKYACAEEMEKIMLQEGFGFSFDRNAIPEIISIKCDGRLCLCK